MARLEIALLGPFRVTRDGEPVTRFETGPARLLLAYLVLHAGSAVPRETLADLLWPERPRSEALHALRQTLSRVRRALGEREGAPCFLQVTPQSVAFDAESDYGLDVDAFTGLIAAVQHHRHRRLTACRPCMRQLAQAADLYRGELLGGFHLESLPFQEWLVMERESLHRQAMEVFYHLAAYHAQRDEFTQAQVYARRQLEAEPWCEEAQRQLMAALASSGQRSAALAQYETCRRILAEELGVEPEPETRRLYDQIRAGDLPLAPPHNLPEPLTRFVGRVAELDAIAELLNDPDHRLLVLSGPGGVGKTRLALAAGRQAIPYFPDGVWFVPLTDVREEAGDRLYDALATAIASAMGILFSGQENPKTQLLRALRPQEALLILDGFEHLTSGANLILDLLSHAPQIVALVTSRARLNTQAEYIVQVMGLPTPPCDDDPVAAGYDSVRLFVERAGSAPAMSGPDLAQIVQVCRLVEGLPLAIELAAAWAEHLPPSEIVANLRQGLDVLSATLQDIPARHRSIRAVLDNSWRLLSEAEQRLLAQLSVFRGDFGRAAVLAVTGAQPAVMVGLAHKSLVQRSGPDRYTLHTLVRQYAAEKLAATPFLTETGDCHSAYYLAFVGQQTPALWGNEPQPATAEMEVELANVRQAWQWAVARLEAGQSPAPHVAALAECARGLACFYTFKGLNQEGEQAFRNAAGRVRAVVQAQEQQSAHADELAASLQALSRLLAAQGHFLAALGDNPSALAVLQEANSASERATALLPGGDPAERATLLACLGDAYNRAGDYAQAVHHLEAALALARQAGDLQAETEALTSLAQVTSEHGDYETAQRRLDQVLTLARAREDRRSEAAALSMLGSLAWRWGDLERADACCQESLAIHRQLGSRQFIPRLLNVLGILAILRQDYGRAEQHYAESLAIAREINDRQAVADMLNNLGYIHHHHTGHLEQARQYYQESLSISREIGHRHGATSTLSNLGHLLVLLGDYGHAWERLREALRESRAIGAAPLMLDALVGVACLWAETGEQERAAELVGLVVNHPATEVDSAQAAEALLTRLRQALPADRIEAAVERGKGLALDTTVADLASPSSGTR